MKKLILLCAFIPLFYLFANAEIYDSAIFYNNNYQHEKALSYIERNFPNDSSLILLKTKAEALKALCHFKEAIECNNKIIKRDSTTLKYRIENGDCYTLIGNNVKALKYYKSAYTIDSNRYIIQKIAKCYHNLNCEDSAISYYKKIITNNPNDLIATYNLAKIYKSEKKYEEGAYITDLFLKTDSTNIKIIPLNGYLHFLNKNYDTATIRFEKCISMKDTSAFVIKYLGYSYFRNHYYIQAYPYLKKSILKDSANINMLYALGSSCLRSGHGDEAIIYLNKVIENSTPDSNFYSMIYQDLADSYISVNKKYNALTSLLKAHSYTPKNLIIIYRLGYHYDFRLKNYKKALRYYKLYTSSITEEQKKKNSYANFYMVSKKRTKRLKEKLFMTKKE